MLRMFISKEVELKKHFGKFEWAQNSWQHSLAILNNNFTLILLFCFLFCFFFFRKRMGKFFMQVCRDNGLKVQYQHLFDRLTLPEFLKGKVCCAIDLFLLLFLKRQRCWKLLVWDVKEFDFSSWRRVFFNCCGLHFTVRWNARIEIEIIIVWFSNVVLWSPQLQNYLNFLTTFTILFDGLLLLHRKPPKPFIACKLFDCILCSDSTDSIKNMGEPAITHRPHIHGHCVYLLSRGMFRIVGFAVRSSKNRHYVGPDHVGSNHARQIQGEQSDKKKWRQFLN